MDLTDPQMVRLLSEEYFFLQKTVEDFNSQAIEFKAWSASIGIAALLAAYTKPVAASGRVGVMVAALAAIPFWVTESLWKLFQKAYEGRLRTIEMCLRGEDCQSFYPLQVWTAWDISFKEAPVADWFSVAFDFHVIFPHVFLFATGIVLAVCWPPRAD
jgi:hypothetical protein